MIIRLIIEVAWRLAREHWGQGYATEAATGWLDHAFGVLGLPRVISVTEPPNLRSLAVMRRLGMVFDHQAEVEEDGAVFQAVVYAITSARWRSRAEWRGSFYDIRSSGRRSSRRTASSGPDQPV